MIKKPSKKTNQKDLVKTVKSKSTCPKCHFGQVGHGGKITIWGDFFIKIFYRKNMISYVDLWTCGLIYIDVYIASTNTSPKIYIIN
jgi:hypothetical protein